MHIGMFHLQETSVLKGGSLFSQKIAPHGGVTFFSDLESSEEIDLSYDLSKEGVWYCFHDLSQRDIDTVKDH